MSDDLPADGAHVRGMTYESISDDLSPRRMEGRLRTRPSPFGGRQCWIGPVQVDPETVELVEDSEDFVEDKEGHEHAGKGKDGGQFVSKGNGGQGGDSAGDAKKPAKKGDELIEHKRANPALPEQARPETTRREAKAVQEYTSASHEVINSLLREGKLPYANLIKTHEALQSLFDKAKPFEKPVTVYRGMNLRLADTEKFLGMVKEALESGKEIRFGGYLSTTTSPRIASNFGSGVRLEIEADKGIDCKSFSLAKQEDELLLNDGTHFAVESMTPGQDAHGRQTWLIKLKQAGRTATGKPDESPAEKFADELAGKTNRFVDQDIAHVSLLVADPEQEDLGDPHERAALIDEIVEHLDAHHPQGIHKYAEVRKDSLGRRMCFEGGKDGKPGKRTKCSQEVYAKEVHEHHAHIQGLKASPHTYTPEAREEVAKRLSGLTLKQLHHLKSLLGLKASGLKSTVRTQLEEGLRKGIKAKSPEVPAQSINKPAVEKDIVSTEATIRKASSTGQALIPDVFDAVKAKHPTLTEPAFHDLLRDMQKRDLLTMQTWGGSAPEDATTGLKAVTGHAPERFPLERDSKGEARGRAAYLDVHAPATPKTANHPATIARAVAKLNKGNPDHIVSLADLRDATGLSVPDLHAAVQALRKTGVLTGSNVEGRHGISPREQESILKSGDDRIGYVSVRDEEGLKKLLRK